MLYMHFKILIIVQLQQTASYNSMIIGTLRSQYNPRGIVVMRHRFRFLFHKLELIIAPKKELQLAIQQQRMVLVQQFDLKMASSINNQINSQMYIILMNLAKYASQQNDRWVNLEFIFREQKKWIPINGYDSQLIR